MKNGQPWHQPFSLGGGSVGAFPPPFFITLNDPYITPRVYA
jgi:hypothetical protein